MTDKQLRACAALIDIVIEGNKPLPASSELKLWHFARTVVPCVNTLDELDAVEVMLRLPAIVANSENLIKLASVLSDVFEVMDKAYTDKASTGASAAICSDAARAQGQKLLEHFVPDPEIQNIVLDSLTKRLGYPFHSQTAPDKGAIPLASPDNISLQTPSRRSVGRPAGSKSKTKSPETKAETATQSAETPEVSSVPPAETGAPENRAVDNAEQPKATTEEIPPLQKPKSSIVNLLNASRDEQLNFLGEVKEPLESIGKTLTSLSEDKAKPIASKVVSILSDLNKAQGSPRHAINIALRTLTENDIKTLLREIETLPEIKEEDKAAVERLRTFLKNFVNTYPNTFGYFEPAALVGD